VENHVSCCCCCCCWCYNITYSNHIMCIKLPFKMCYSKNNYLWTI
jgi:hypothetical protein